MHVSKNLFLKLVVLFIVSISFVWGEIQNGNFIYDDFSVRFSGKDNNLDFSSIPQNLKMQKFNSQIQTELLISGEKYKGSFLSFQLEPGEWSCQILDTEDFADGVVSAKILCEPKQGPQAMWQGVCIRAKAGINYNRTMYIFIYDHSDGQLRLERYNGSKATRTILGTGELGNPLSGWHVLSIETKGNLLSCY